MENFLPFTDDVMVVLVHKCVQQTHLLALHLETLGYIPRLLNALNGLVYFLIIGDPRGDNLMVGSISRKLLTELGIYISQLIRFARASSYVVDFNTRNKLLTQKLLKQGYRYHKLRKTFSNPVFFVVVFFVFLCYICTGYFSHMFKRSCFLCTAKLPY